MKKNRWRDGGDMQIIVDFLPSPQELVFRKETKKNHYFSDKNTIYFFKDEAKKNYTQYQKMIRDLLDTYTQKHQSV